MSHLIKTLILSALKYDVSSHLILIMIKKISFTLMFKVIEWNHAIMKLGITILMPRKLLKKTETKSSDIFKPFFPQTHLK